ncbi:hypothetical protein Y037_3054 [Burkholderia pseudomallei MSHR983]|uniref:hypothetical protein n=1 Tax=Burkholderia pseudomallei TaxID=28450 RepID=UPI0005384A06|nr:hypothetical protein [Burkholderia pseudomallei]KGU65643.1 hypothetical protein Y037_3054 [Burkholderia pseudomallei MSHR983]
MKPIFDAHSAARRAAIQRMQQSYFPPVKPIESSIAWRFVMVAAVVVILVNLLPGNDTASSSPTRTHSRVQV